MSNKNKKNNINSNNKSKGTFMFMLIFLVTGILYFIAYQGFGEGHILSYRNIQQGLDLSGGVYIVYEAQEEENDGSGGDGEPSWEQKMSAAISMVQSRLDRKGWTEANVFKEGTDRIRVEIPGVEDAETAVSEIGQTAKLTFTDIDGNVVVSGEDVVNATQRVQTTQMGVQEIVVSLEFNAKGTEDFANATEANIGNPIYILLDDAIISAPTVNQKISNGEAVISGGFTIESAEELSSLIRSGSLPFELKILEMNTIGATLGANALASSILGGAVGIGLVLVSMIVLYKASGFAANLALAIYMALMLLLLNGLNITLTLQGIAGIILSVGMAVDANVIIFERIREEVLGGRTLRLAVDKGFERAFPAIVDSNITTLIAGGVLYWLGSGTIKGFAQTLMLGIALSMFTSLFITKFITKTMIQAGINNAKLYGAK